MHYVMLNKKCKKVNDPLYTVYSIYNLLLSNFLINRCLTLLWAGCFNHLEIRFIFKTS